MMKYFYILLLFISFNVAAQPPNPVIPIQRQLWHDKIAAQQKLLDKMDGKADSLVKAGNNEEVNEQLTDEVFRKINLLKNWVEKTPSLKNNRDKVIHLRSIEYFLQYFREDWKAKKISPLEFPQLRSRFEDILNNIASGKPVVSQIENLSYPQASILVRSMPDIPEKGVADVIVYKKFAYLYPEKILSTIRPYADQPFADSLIIIAAKKSPVQLYSFAQNRNSTEGKLIRRSTDPMVKNVAELSETPNALFYFPFLDDILSGKTPINEIKKYVGDGGKNYDSVGYYKLLVKTAVDYRRRLNENPLDTAINMYGTNGLYETLQKKALQHFVMHINELHDRPEAVRMRAVEPLSPVDLYYMMVLSENDIFTSSYRHSFNRMLQRMNAPRRTDSLLISVGYDHFKKFIKMAANYNQLDTFLALMPAESSSMLMKKFVDNLDKSATLEDAVDVADSYSSINNAGIKRSILQNIEENEVKSNATGNERGGLIYGLLKTIFLSEDSTKVDLTKSIGIPSIFEVNNQLLQDEKGRIVQQVFFYGDDDGRNIFNGFLGTFSPKEWTYTPKKEWVEFKHKKGEIYVFANRPLNYDQNLDDSAQAHLNVYLQSIGMQPTIVVHRGHSYWLNGTIKRMPNEAKIVFLGSCGGYQNLSKILSNSPDAHIISTKEIGTGLINKAVLEYLTRSTTAKQPIVWKSMWNTLTTRFMKDPNRNIREGWESYVPPYKNLGVIFLKAYRLRTDSME